jgi:sirohydrochlorin cobaltochelatase
LTAGLKLKRDQSTTAKEGLILFAHGSRNPAWRRPFDRLIKDMVKRSECQAVLAFGEFMSPGLTEAAQALVAAGVKKAVIVPLFLGGGSHVHGDLPKLARQARAASGLRLSVAKAIGDDAGVLAAIADYCVSNAGVRLTASRRKPS